MLNVSIKSEDLQEVKDNIIAEINFLEESYYDPTVGYSEPKNYEGNLSEIVNELISDLSLDNYAEIIKTIEKLTGDYVLTKKIIKDVYNIHAEYLATQLSDFNKNCDMTKTEQDSIHEYISAGYEYINAYLYDEYDNEIQETEELLNTIDTLDNIIENNSIEIKNVLYRGQSLVIDEVEKIIENKEFTFKNYVSTSVAPIIFGGWETNSTSLYCENNYDSYVEKLKYNVNVSWVIDTKGSKGFVVGDLAWNPIECEVILPRNTCLKINKVVESFGNETKRQFTIFAEIV